MIGGYFISQVGKVVRIVILKEKKTWKELDSKPSKNYNLGLLVSLLFLVLMAVIVNLFKL